MRILAAALAGVLLAGCTVDGVKKAPPPTTSAACKTWPPAPRGWRQTGTMTVNGQVVPVYSEDYRGEGQSPYQMALNPASCRIQAFSHDQVGNVIWKRDPMEP